MSLRTSASCCNLTWCQAVPNCGSAVWLSLCQYPQCDQSPASWGYQNRWCLLPLACTSPKVQKTGITLLGWRSRDFLGQGLWVLKRWRQRSIIMTSSSSKLTVVPVSAMQMRCFCHPDMPMIYRSKFDPSLIFCAIHTVHFERTVNGRSSSSPSWIHVYIILGFKWYSAISLVRIWYSLSMCPKSD